MTALVQIVASNMVVAVAVGLLAWAVGRGGRRAPLAHALWIVFFVKLVTPPLMAIPIATPVDWFPPAWVPDAPLPGPIAVAAPGHEGTSADPVRLSHRDSETQRFRETESLVPHMTVGFWGWLAVVWACGSMWVFARGLLRFVRFRRLLLRESAADSEATRFVADLLRTARQKSLFRAFRGSCPEVRRLPVRVSPMLFGFGRRAAIVCPDQLWQALSENERRSFLAHEAAHFFRRDHWVRWLEWFVTALYWWFPAVYLARRELERHEEAACDAWAVRELQATPRQYGETLLRVVDFLSEHRVGIPRLASGMQPTDSLEQRLRLLMRPSGASPASRPVQWSASLVCLSLWMVHPWLQPRLPESSSLTQLRPGSSSTAAHPSPATGLQFPSGAVGPGAVGGGGGAVGGGALSLHSLASRGAELPDPPRGFWNAAPRRQWADFSLSLPGARLIADASRGIAIERPTKEPLRFSGDQLTAIVEIPSTRRVVIGDELGRLRLWDLEAGQPTSLIGRHGAAVTSLAYHPSCGIVAADAAGAVTRWDLQSGHVLARWSGSSAPVQSVRCSSDGRTIAILVGSWREVGTAQEIHLVDAASLGSTSSVAVPPQTVPPQTVPSSGMAPGVGRPSTAVVLQAESAGWVAVEWSGAVRLVNTGQPVAQLAKHDVSAFVLSQEAASTAWLGATRQADSARTLSEDL